MIRINLVPADILARAHQRQQLLQLSAGGIVVAAIVVMVSLAHLYKLNSLQRTLAYDQAKLKTLQVIVAQVEELEKTRDAVRARLKVVQDLLKGRTLYPTFMCEFVRSVPGGIRVRTLGTTGGGSSAGPLKLAVSAESRTNEDIAAWIKKMEESGRFDKVELGPVTVSGAAEKLVAFTLNLMYVPAP
ncbi:MAG: hypothetical protein HY077_01705 [Elusimicrobia bacterium]|nr:hypothetical protein [Elusimicrobiota bacterium]